MGSEELLKGGEVAASGSGLDIDGLPTATKILLGAAVLLLIDSLALPWQSPRISMWGGSASWAGILTGTLAIALVAWEGIRLTGSHPHTAGQTAEQTARQAARIGVALGLGIVVVGALKFLLVVIDGPALGAFVGIVLILAIGYGAWMRAQEPAPPSSTVS